MSAAKPVIGIITNFDHDPHYLFAGHARLTINEDYSRSVTAAGGVPLLIPSGADTSNLPAQLALVDGLLLAGGPDVDPLRYGQDMMAACGPTSPVRDAYEFAALEHAREMGLPVFGICRGMQVLNVFLGGTLFQDLSYAGTGQLHMASANPASPVHGITIADGSFLADALGTSTCRVNSFHHQAVDRLAPELLPVAHAADGLVEAVQTRGEDGLRAAAVQWHPEMMSGHDLPSQHLFTWMVDWFAREV